MEFITEWIEKTGICCGPVIRAMRKNGKPQDGLSGGSVGKIFKRLAVRANLPESIASGLSGHSARVGAAQDMAAAGIDIIAIMQAGGWKSPNIVGRYIENLDVLRGGSYRLAMQQQQRR